MKQVVNMYDEGQRFNIFNKHVDYLPSEAMQPNYIKIMLLILHKLNENS